MTHQQTRCLTALVNEGYTSMGLNYGCGCLWSGWYKKGKLVYEQREKCYEHRQSDSDGGPTEKWQVNAEPEALEGTTSPNSIQG